MAEETGTARGIAAPDEIVTITVGPNNTLSVNKPSITLSKRQGNRATWQIQGGTDFSIVFDVDSPFDQKRYDHRTAKSLTPRPSAPLDTFKYTVQVPGCNDLDPELIVEQ